MYMAFTEEQAREIRKLGIPVIEWKNCVRKGVKAFVYIINRAVEKAAKAWGIIKDAIKELADRFRFAIEEIREHYSLPVSYRYKFVKILGAMGCDKQRVWTLTRRTWLARSNC